MSFEEYAQIELIKGIAPAASLLESSMHIYNLKNVYSHVKIFKQREEPSLHYLTNLKADLALPLVKRI